VVAHRFCKNCLPSPLWLHIGHSRSDPHSPDQVRAVYRRSYNTYRASPRQPHTGRSKPSLNLPGQKKGSAGEIIIVPIQFLEHLGAHLAKSAFDACSSSRSFGWVKIFSVGQCYINQIERRHSRRIFVPGRARG
jgi:hypothetical protein